jgi:hypothetical protein
MTRRSPCLTRTTFYCLLVIASYGCGREGSPRYQIVQGPHGVIVRLDTSTGVLVGYQLRQPDEGYRQATEHALYFHEVAVNPLPDSLWPKVEAAREKLKAEEATRRAEWERSAPERAKQERDEQTCNAKIPASLTPAEREQRRLECWAATQLATPPKGK